MEKTWKREWLPLEQIEENQGQLKDAGIPANPRTISPEKLEALCRSLEDLPEMEEARDILVIRNGDKYIALGGNMRLRAKRKLGAKGTWCCIAPNDLPAKKIRAIIMQDNNEYGQTDWESLMANWDHTELTAWNIDIPDDILQQETGEKQPEEDGYSDSDAANAPAMVKAGELWQLGRHRLMCEDSTAQKCLNTLMGGGKYRLVYYRPAV